MSIFWCPHEDLNPGPTAYKAVALPLSYKGNNGLEGRIRTYDPLLPKQVRYQTALLLDKLSGLFTMS